jgi:hypothetical protein
MSEPVVCRGPFYRLLLSFALILTIMLCAKPSMAQEPDPKQPAGTSSGSVNTNANSTAPDNSRILGVLPNYLTTENALPYSPIPAREKLKLSIEESFDWPLLFVNGGLALIYHAQREEPSWGFGAQGYAKRYAAVYADDITGNLLGDGVLPALLHEDPRYFRRGTGSVASRLGFSLRQIVVARTDSGKWHFANSEIFGNAIATGISNIYYRESRTVSGNMQKFGVQIGSDAVNSLLEEFWPDLKRRFFQRHP